MGLQQLTTSDIRVWSRLSIIEYIKNKMGILNYTGFTF